MIVSGSHLKDFTDLVRTCLFTYYNAEQFYFGRFANENVWPYNDIVISCLLSQEINVHKTKYFHVMFLILNENGFKPMMNLGVGESGKSEEN